MIKKNKIINVNELQAKASRVIKDVSEGQTYEVMRYSRPVAMIISRDEYECLSGKCHACVKSFIKTFKVNSKIKIPSKRPGRQK